MQRRAALKAIGVSVLAGATLTSTASATKNGPRVVDVDSEISTENTDAGDEYSVEYDGNTVIITGGTTVPESCYEAEVVGIDSSSAGDVVQVAPHRYGEICTQVISRLTFEIELEYDDEPNDVSVEFVDQ